MSHPPRPTSAYFDRHSAAYEQHAVIQAEAGRRLLDRMEGLSFQPGRILEVACADGRQCMALRQRFPKARIVGLDCSAGMLKRARKRRRWWRRDFELLRADGGRLPLAEDSIDLIYANLSLGWLADLPTALLSWRRALRPGGLLLASVYGPDTLRDWRQRFLPPELGLVLPDVQTFGSALVRAGFAEPVLDTDWMTSIHPSPRALLAELRGGALLPARGRRLGLRAQRLSLKTFEAEAQESAAECRAEWEIVSASAWAPEPGQALRHEHGEEVSVPISAIGIRRRQ